MVQKKPYKSTKINLPSLRFYYFQLGLKKADNCMIDTSKRLLLQVLTIPPSGSPRDQGIGLSEKPRANSRERLYRDFVRIKSLPKRHLSAAMIVDIWMWTGCFFSRVNKWLLRGFDTFMPTLSELQEVGQRRICQNLSLICWYLLFVNGDLWVLLLLIVIHSGWLHDLSIPKVAPCLV